MLWLGTVVTLVAGVVALVVVVLGTRPVDVDELLVFLRLGKSKSHLRSPL